MTTSPAKTPVATATGTPADAGDSRTVLPRGLVILLGTAAVVVVLAGMHAATWLIAPIFLALVIVIALHPVRQWLSRRGWPGWLTTAVLILLVYALLGLITLVVIASIGRLATLLPSYTKNAQELTANLTSVLRNLGIGQEQARETTHAADFSNILNFIGSLLSELSTLVTGLVFLLALLLFLSVESRDVGARIDTMATDRPQVADALGRFATGTRKYLIVTTIFGLIVAVLDTAALTLLGIPLVILWGLLSFITNYIPNIGFFLGLIPPALLGLLVGGWQLLLAVIVVYCVLNFVVQSLIQPRFVGDSVGLSVTVTFVALLFWGWILGALGALLAIPLTLLVKTLLVDIDPRANWANALLRQQTPSKRHGNEIDSNKKDSNKPGRGKQGGDKQCADEPESGDKLEGDRTSHPHKKPRMEDGAPAP